MVFLSTIPVLDLQDKEKLLEALYHESIRAIREYGAEAIVLGCTAMIDVAEELEAALKDAELDVPVLEAAQSALLMLELHAKMGLKHSKLTYRRPREK